MSQSERSILQFCDHFIIINKRKITTIERDEPLNKKIITTTEKIVTIKGFIGILVDFLRK